MDQEAEIIKQSRARQEAALAAAAEDDEEEEPGGPLRTVSSGARGAAVACVVGQNKSLCKLCHEFRHRIQSLYTYVQPVWDCTVLKLHSRKLLGLATGYIFRLFGPSDI